MAFLAERPVMVSPTMNRTLVVVGLMLSSALAAMDSTIVATAIPSIVRDLGGFAVFPWLFSIYLLIQAVTIPIYGKLADIYGRKPVLLAGVGFFLLGSVLSGLSWNMTALIVFRGLQGVGAGAILPITATVIADIFSIEERARMQGYLASVWGVSSVVGPSIGGLIVQYSSWRWIFYINLPVGAAALFMIATQLREHVTPHRHRLDIPGAALLATGVGLWVLGLLEGGVAWGWSSHPSVITFGVGLLLLAAFLVQERRAEEPMLPMWVFGERMLLAANLGSLVVGVLSSGISAFLPTFVQGYLGATPLVAGMTLGAMTVGWPLAASLAGMVYLRTGFRRAAIGGGCLTLVGGLAFAHLGPAATSVDTAAASFVLGLGLGLSATTLLVGIQSVVAWERRGVVTGANLFTRMLGSTVGVAAFGSVLNGSLSAWLSRTPVALRGHIPATLGATTFVLGKTPGISSQAVAFIRQGLYLGVHRMFLATAGAALLLLAFTFMVPRRLTPILAGAERSDGPSARAAAGGESAEMSPAPPSGSRP